MPKEQFEDGRKPESSILENLNLKAANALMAFILSVSAGCRKNVERTVDQQQQVSAMTSVKAEAVKEVDEGLDLPFDKTVRLPEFEITNNPVKSKVPDGLQMNPEDFENFCRAFVGIILAQGVPSYNQKSNVNDFLGWTANLIETGNAATRTYMQDFARKFEALGKTPEVLFAEINKFARPGGIYFYHRFHEGQMRIGVFPVTSSKYVNVTLDGQKYEVPVYMLGENLSKDDVLPEGALAGTNAPFFTHAFVFGVKLEKSNAGMEEALKHETAHVALGQRFVSSKIINRQDLAFGVDNLKIPFNQEHTAGADLNGPYSAVHFHEACGVGVQIANSANPKEQLKNYFAAFESGPKDSAYELVYKLAPMMALDALPKDARESFIQDLIKANGNMDLLKLRNLVDTLSDEAVREAGQNLYKIGHTLLRDAEKGKYDVMQKVTQ